MGTLSPADRLVLLKRCLRPASSSPGMPLFFPGQHSRRTPFASAFHNRQTGLPAVHSSTVSSQVLDLLEDDELTLHPCHARSCVPREDEWDIGLGPLSTTFFPRHGRCPSPTSYDSLCTIQPSYPLFRPVTDYGTAMLSLPEDHCVMMHNTPTQSDTVSDHTRFMLKWMASDMALPAPSSHPIPSPSYRVDAATDAHGPVEAASVTSPFALGSCIVFLSGSPSLFPPSLVLEKRPRSSSLSVGHSSLLERCIGS
ncbi:hypothetical protein C8F01DRAFT_1255480 [Mycena amicta]|nr:hypothetical protein C8F01DRAFT_1255480 [Mycena amicta]